MQHLQKTRGVGVQLLLTENSNKSACDIGDPKAKRLPDLLGEPSWLRSLTLTHRLECELGSELEAARAAASQDRVAGASIRSGHDREELTCGKSSCGANRESSDVVEE